MSEEKKWYVKAADSKVYGPATMTQLVAWCRDGRIEPASLISSDRRSWMPAQTVPELEMKWIVETEPGKLFGPFNRTLVIGLQARGEMPTGAKLYKMHELLAEQDPPPVVVEKIVEKEVIKEVRVEVPVEVEKIVEKEVIKEVRVEVPVEKIVERVIEVAPPPRRVVTAEVLEEPSGATPPVRLEGIFKDVSSDKLKALEAAAQREIAAANKHRFGSRLFGRR